MCTHHIVVIGESGMRITELQVELKRANCVWDLAVVFIIELKIYLVRLYVVGRFLGAF